MCSGGTAYINVVFIFFNMENELVKKKNLFNLENWQAQ